MCYGGYDKLKCGWAGFWSWGGGCGCGGGYDFNHCGIKSKYFWKHKFHWRKNDCHY